MPNYDYRCERTGEMFEIWQAFTDDPLTACPQTHAGDAEACGAAVRKVFSKVGISFKGDGFYTNDHGARSRGSKTASDGSSDAPGTDKQAGESSSDSSSSPESGSSSDTGAASDKPTSGSSKAEAGSSSGTKAKDATAAA